ncbi:glycosyltransferase family 4 protein [bacterium]|nr:glycosyltransferase family 4 protein [bacterium]
MTANRPLSIAYIANTGEFGGGERYLSKLVGCPSGEGIRVYMPPGTAAEEFARRTNGAHVEPLSTNGYSIHPVSLAHSIKFYKGLDCDLFHFNLANPCSSTIDIIAARLFTRAPVVLTTHLPTISKTVREKISGRTALGCAHMVITVCESARRFLIERGVDAEKVRTIYNGVTDWVTPDSKVRELRDELHIGKDDVIIGTVARLERQKNISSLLHAFQSVSIEHRNAALCIVGTGSLLDELQRLAHELGIADRVRFCGWRSDTCDILRMLDIFVLPSAFESFPFTIVEAMMAGLPVIATRVGGVDEAVIDGKTGILVEPKDDDALTKAVKLLLDRPDMRFEMGNAGRGEALARFTEDEMLRRTWELYSEMTAKQRCSG